jgi:hypothetical protein
MVARRSRADKAGRPDQSKSNGHFQFGQGEHEYPVPGFILSGTPDFSTGWIVPV